MKSSLVRHRFFAIALVASATALLLPGCKPSKVAPPSDQAGRTVSGRIDWSEWQRWVQTPPRVALVSDIDSDTLELISRQSELFLTVIGKSSASSANTLPETELSRLKDAFFASSSRTANSPVPTVERWDRYSNAVRRIQPDSMATSVTTLEAYVNRDRQDLTPKTGNNGDSGRQARSDLAWIDSAVMPILRRLKEHQASAKPALTVEQARNQWQTFETDSLPKIASAIESATTASAEVAADGTYVLQGRGQLVAIVPVAGRNLYFPVDSAAPGLRFLP